MFADSGARLPPGVGTVTPEEVADAVVRAIERNRGEIDVAPAAHPPRGRSPRTSSPSSRRP